MSERDPQNWKLERLTGKVSSIQETSDGKFNRGVRVGDHED